MKKGLLSLLVTGAAALVLSSCGAKYTPLTEEQKTAQADSTFTATAADLKTQKEADCAAGMEAKVAEKVAELTAAAAPTAEAEKK